MDKLSRDVFGNISFTKQLKDNKAFYNYIMKIYFDYSCLDYFNKKNYKLTYYTVTLN